MGLLLLSLIRSEKTTLAKWTRVGWLVARVAKCTLDATDLESLLHTLLLLLNQVSFPSHVGLILATASALETLRQVS